MKKNILYIISAFLFLASGKLQAQTITVSNYYSSGPLYFCGNPESNDFGMIGLFSLTGVFDPSNVFTLELSDQNGDFTTPISTMIVSSPFGNFNLFIPTTALNGSGYLVRMKSSNPIVFSNNLPLTINQPPTVFTTSASPNQVLYGTGTTISLSGSQTGIPYRLQDNLVGGGTGHAAMYYIHYLPPINGTGGTIDFATGNLTITTDYNVRAYQSVSPYCKRDNNIVTVTVYSVENSDTGDRFATLQEAINAATTGQTINILASRFYDEDVVVDRNLTFTSSVANYNEAAIKSVKVNSGVALTIDGDMSVREVLEVENNAQVQVTGGNFALLSDTSGTAMVINDGNGVVNGNIIMKRQLLDPTTIPGYTGTYNGQGYHMFSSPFSHATVSQFSDDMVLNIPPSYNTSTEPAYTVPFPTFYRYNETRSNAPSASGYYSAFTMGYEVPLATDVLEKGRGYEINIAAGANVDLKGTLTNGNVTIPLSNTATGYNLIGNPYPSPIKWSEVYALSSNINPTISIDIKTGQYAATFATYNPAINVSINGGADDVASMQGFFVRAIGANPEVIMNNTVRPTTYQNTRFFKTEQNQDTEIAKEGLIKLGILSEGNMDETAIVFIEGATSKYDDLYDAEKIHKINGYVPTLYSYNEDLENLTNKYYAINVLPKFDEDMILPLGMNIVKSGKHKIVVREVKYFHSLSNIYLYDSLTETLHDLKANPEYEFVAEQGTEVKRFVILFKTNKTFTQKDHIVAYPNPTSTDFSYSLKNDREGIHTVRVFDAIGKLIIERREDKQGAFLEGIINLEEQPFGLYLLQISDSKQTTNVRIIKE